MSKAKTTPVGRIVPRLLLALLLAGVAAMALFGAIAAEREHLSFEMWCLDMRQHSPVRCDARRSDDVKDYERYRASVEKFDRQRSEQKARDQALQDRLNRDPGAARR